MTGVGHYRQSGSNGVNAKFVDESLTFSESGAVPSFMFVDTTGNEESLMHGSDQYRYCSSSINV